VAPAPDVGAGPLPERMGAATICLAAAWPGLLCVVDKVEAPFRFAESTSHRASRYSTHRHGVCVPVFVPGSRKGGLRGFARTTREARLCGKSLRCAV
jgi:hypothetical protein